MSEIDAHHPPSKKARSEPLSEESRKLVKKAFTTTLSNAERREIHTRELESGDPFTRYPRVDPLFKTTEFRFAGSSEGKQVDVDLQKIQALVLDVSALLLELLAAMEPGTEDPPCLPREAMEDAVRLLGNIVGQFSKIRRRRILKACNPDVHDLADNEELFTEASPNPFGPQNEREGRECEAPKKEPEHSGWYSQAVFRGGHSREEAANPTGEAEHHSWQHLQAQRDHPPKKPTQRQN